MKRYITALLLLLVVGCTHHKFEMSAVSTEALTCQLNGKSLTHIEIYKINTTELVRTVNDKKLITEFRDSLASCKPMSQIDTMGSHSILVHSQDGVARFDTDFHYFIRVPDWNGQDAYFECSSELRTVLRKMKANQSSEPTRYNARF